MAERGKSIDLSLVIGAYQEAKRIGQSLDELATWLQSHDYGAVEVVVVTADSPDGTADIVRSHAKKFASLHLVEPGPKMGKGRDIRDGMLAATGKVRLFMDADLATPLHHIDEAVAAIASGSDVAIAVRDLSSSHTGVRKFVSWGGNLLSRTLVAPDITDTQCGFKAFTAEAAETIFSRLTIMGWGFDMEVIAIAKAQGYQITTIPAPDWHDAPDGTVTGGVGGAALSSLGDLAKITAKRATRSYK